MKYSLIDGCLNAPCDPRVIIKLLEDLGVNLPEDYVAFLESCNGGEGFLGENYFIFWKAEELVIFNKEYEVDKYAPGILLFASSGAGEGYGFDCNESLMPIVRIPFIGMSRQYIEPVASDFSEMFVGLVD